ncbi:MAG: type II secretion system protein [Lachnospiraceae bacterium]|nr:type II secretion system protein [Lachnospiraceae bacterium]
MKNMKNNQGFSLVELIIVIAIMGILVGALAPIMIKYVERSNIASDQQLLDSVYQAVTFAVADPDINNDPASKTLIDSLTTPCTLESLMTPANNKLAEDVMDTLGWTDLNQSTYENLIRSAHASNCEIYLVYQGGIKNPLVMWISTTDQTGKKDTSNTSTDPDNIGDCICIR